METFITPYVGIFTMGTPGPTPKVTPADVLEVFDTRDDPAEPLTAPEVADALGCSRRTALDKLQTLADRGILESKKVGGRAVVWWWPTTQRPTTDIDPEDPLFTGEPLLAPEDPVDETDIDDVVYVDPDG